MRRPVIQNGSDIGKKTFPVNQVPSSSKLPVIRQEATNPNFSFSFKYFRQVKHFQLGQVPNNWYVSLIERLQQLCEKQWESFEKDFIEKKSFRYHDIDWGGKNVPIKREDLNWIDKHYLNNEEDFPMLQFHVSKALGRVVGFWDAFHVFQIVLLDPEHNIQPSNYNSYKIKDTYYMSSEYASLLSEISEVKNKIPHNSDCVFCKQMTAIPSKLNETNLVIACLDDDYFETLKKSGKDITTVFQLGIIAT